FAGIYGPGRLIGQTPLQAGTPLPGDPERWLNLIHVADGASAVLAADDRAGRGKVFNVVDDEPVRREEVYRFLAGQLGLLPPRFDLQATDPTNRRVRNARLKLLGWQPRYPTYREGLSASLTRTV